MDTPEGNREQIIRQMQAMTGIDRLVGHLREKLEAEGLSENTILVFLSDHGLFMGEFGLGGKALCYEKTTKIPMMIFVPLALNGPKAGRSREMVQSIDIAPTMLDFAGIPIPESYQGKSLKPLLTGDMKSIREWVFTENIWATHFGNPPCQSVQNYEWKYIRYYKNESMSASRKVELSRAIGLKANDVLYGVYDEDALRYRAYVEGPLEGETPIYEELYHLSVDPDETTNVINLEENREILQQMRSAWDKKIREARGDEKTPSVSRITKDSMAELGKPYHSR